MSLFAFPCIYLNLGAEMIFVLEQRLEAQGATEQKTQKVIRDIVGSIAEERNTTSLFTPQPLQSYKRLKQTFFKLVNSTSVSLSKDAMDKLFDLMIMATKYKVFLCKTGHELLMLTLSQLDTIRPLIVGSPAHISMVNKISGSCIKWYHTELSRAQLELVRQTVLNFLQDSHIKVALFLQERLQLPNGRFALPYDGTVPFGSEIPGKITYLYNKDHKVDVVPLAVQYYRIDKEGSLEERGGDRRSSLPQLKLYEPERKSKVGLIHNNPSQSPSPPPTEEEEEEWPRDSVGHAELDLLQSLLIGFKSPSEMELQQPFKLTLFEDDSELEMSSGEKGAQSSKSISERNTVKIDSSKSSTRSTVIQEIMEDFEDKTSITTGEGEGSDTRGVDLLSLMDTL